eukprot:scaffold957_cov180-Chaetoceros_neogracile.AAC.6
MDIIIVQSSMGDGYRHRGLPSDPRNTGGSFQEGRGAVGVHDDSTSGQPPRKKRKGGGFGQ